MHQLLTDTTLYIDKSRMAQVIRNLMSNALKFTPSGGVVRITAERITDSITSPVSSHNGVSLSGPQELLRLQIINSGADIDPVRCHTTYINYIYILHLYTSSTYCTCSPYL